MTDVRIEVQGAVVEAGDWLWGMLQGDFNERQTASQALVGGLISMIPGIDQVFDVRDLIANLRKIAQDNKEIEAWIALVLTLIGLVPLVGSALKTAFKVARKTKRLDEVLAVLRAAGYGDARKYLRTLEWDALTRQALSGYNQSLLKVQHLLRDMRYGWLSRRVLSTDMQRRLELAEKEILALKEQGARMVPDAMKRLRAEIDALFKQDYKAAVEKAARTNQSRQVVKNSERPLMRLEYEMQVKALKRDEDAMRAAGKSDSEIAKALHEKRRNIGEDFKDRTDPELREVIYGRNQARGNDPTKGNKLGLTYEELKAGKTDMHGNVLRKPKTDREIIESAQRPDGGDFAWDLILERQHALDRGDLDKAKNLLEKIRDEVMKASGKH